MGGVGGLCLLSSVQWFIVCGQVSDSRVVHYFTMSDSCCSHSLDSESGSLLAHFNGLVGVGDCGCFCFETNLTGQKLNNRIEISKC